MPSIITLEYDKLLMTLKMIQDHGLPLQTNLTRDIHISWEYHVLICQLFCAWNSIEKIDATNINQFNHLGR